jgi:fucose permease
VVRQILISRRQYWISDRYEPGWVVEYLVDVRHGKLSQVGYTPAGLYGGLFLGRLLLAEPTHRFGERQMILLYCVIILGLQLIFWLVPNIIANATALSLLGFFFGPLFPIVSRP